MKIYGPYKYTDHNGKDRQLVNIIEDDGSKRSQSYPRYLMEQHLGRKLEPTEDVDHVDRDTMNNDIGNLRVLSLKENRGMHNPAAAMTQFVCVQCGETAERETRRIRHNQKVQGKAGPFCDKKCARAWQLKPLYPNR